MESLTVPADLDSLATISVFITDATSRAGLDDHAAWQVQLAVDEASTNIIRHGYSDAAPGEIELAWQVDGPDLVVTLRDRGRRFNPARCARAGYLLRRWKSARPAGSGCT